MESWDLRVGAVWQARTDGHDTVDAKESHLPWDIEPGTCLCVAILRIKIGSMNVPSVLSKLLCMFNYEYITKLICHCLALPSVN